MKGPLGSVLRTAAQTIRRASGGYALDQLWDVMRGPYLKTLQLLAGSEGIAVKVGGSSIRLDPAFATLDWEKFEVQSYRTFAGHVHPGDVVYDVGAHIGTYSLLALERSKPDGVVVAFEPDDTARGYLRQHVRRGGFERRTVIRDVCCGSALGTATFFYCPGKAEGTSGLLPVEGFATKPTAVTTIDREVDQSRLIPKIVKIDVEGAEMEVLKGAERTLELYRPRLFVSLHPRELGKMKLEPSIVFDWLTARGYTCRLLGQDHEIHVFAEPC